MISRISRAQFLLLAISLIIGCSPAPAPVPAPVPTVSRTTPSMTLRQARKGAPMVEMDPKAAEQAACRGRDGKWYCPGIKPMLAASESGPIIPSSWTVSHWWWDGHNVSTFASDLNNCTSALTPCLTLKEILIHRLGCQGTPEICPRFQQTTTLTALSNDLDTDISYLSPGFENNAVLNVNAGVITTTPITLGAVTAKNRTAGANSPLEAVLGASFAPGTFLHNTTHPSNAWVYKLVSGTTYVISQPLVAAAADGSTPSPAEVDSWTIGDHVTANEPVHVNLAFLQPTPGLGSGAVNLYQVVISDPSGVGFDDFTVQTGASFSISFIESRVDRFLQEIPSGNSIVATNSPIAGGAAIGAGLFSVGGYLLSTNVTQGGGLTLDGDAIVGPHNATTVGLTLGGGSNNTFGFVYQDAPVNIVADSIVMVEAIVYGGTQMYGDPAVTLPIQLGVPATVRNAVGNGTWAATFTQAGLITNGFVIGGLNQACSRTIANPSVMNCAVGPLTPANMDATFGGLAFRLNGGVVTSN